MTATHTDVFAQIVGRIDSTRRRPWRDRQELSRIVQLAADTTEVTQLVDRLHRGGQLDRVTGARLRRLLGYVVEVGNDSTEASEHIRRLASAVPRYLLDCVSVPPTGRIQEEGLADAHVHFGAAMSERDLLSGLMQQAEPRQVPEVSLRDVAGVDLSLRAVVHYLRRFTMCAQFGVHDAVLSEDFWLNFDSALLTTWDESSRGNSWNLDGLDETLRVDRSTLDIKHLAAIVGAGSHNGWSGSAIDASLHLMCLAHLAVSSPDRSSLDRFVDGFERTSLIAKSGLSQEERFRSAITWTGEGLERLELRKTYPWADGPSLADSLKHDVKSLKNAIRAHGGNTAIQMPLTFLKDGTPIGHHERFTLWHQIQVADAFVDFMYLGGIDANLRGLVAALDVVGREQAQPNWIYCVAMNHVIGRVSKLYGDEPIPLPGANRFPIEVSAHAGESFSTGVGGVRAIREYVDNVPWMTRVGHALALGTDYCERAYSENSLRSVAAIDLIENVAWARSQDAERVSGAMVDVALKLARRVFDSPVPSIESLSSWYGLRFDSDFLRNELGYDALASLTTTEMSSDRSSRDLFGEYYFPGTTNFYLSTDECGLSELEMRLLLEWERQTYAWARIETIRILNERDIVVEVCPSSNCALARVPIHEHPLRNHVGEFSMSINSDDPVVFGSRLLDELELMSGSTGSEQRTRFKATTLAYTARAVDQALIQRIFDN